MFLVLTLLTETIVEVGGISQEVGFDDEDGLAGVLPAFQTREAAEAYVARSTGNPGIMEIGFVAAGLKLFDKDD